MHVGLDARRPKWVPILLFSWPLMLRICEAQWTARDMASVTGTCSASHSARIVLSAGKSTSYQYHRCTSVCTNRYSYLKKQNTWIMHDDTTCSNNSWNIIQKHVNILHCLKCTSVYTTLVQNLRVILASEKGSITPVVGEKWHVLIPCIHKL